MNLSDDQVKLFWRQWPKSCAAMGWTRAAGMSAKEIDLKRKEFLLRCGFDSLTKVDRLDGFTKVKNELLVLQGVSLKAAGETIDPSLNQARVLRNQILTEIIPCLELYRGENLPGELAGIMEDKNRWWKLDRPARGMTLMDLDARPIFRTDRATGEQKYMGSQLSQMQWTLARWMNDLRNAAGDTIHTMKMKAGVRCDCATGDHRQQALLPLLPVEESWTDFDPELETVTDEFGGASGEEGGDPF
jgi:hypothetical protein